MTSIERTAYPRFGPLVSARELTSLSPSADEVLWARDLARSDVLVRAAGVAEVAFGIATIVGSRRRWRFVVTGVAMPWARSRRWPPTARHPDVALPCSPSAPATWARAQAEAPVSRAGRPEGR